MCLFGPPRSIDSRGSIANFSLSSFPACVIAILGTVIRGPDCLSFHLSHALVPTADSTGELLTGCPRGQYVVHWLGN